MERLNGEIRDREEVTRGLKKPDTPIISGYQIYHNYVRPHEALEGRTPAEACGIVVKGENKWLTIIKMRVVELFYSALLIVGCPLDEFAHMVYIEAIGLGVSYFPCFCYPLDTLQVFQI